MSTFDPDIRSSEFYSSKRHKRVTNDHNFGDPADITHVWLLNSLVESIQPTKSSMEVVTRNEDEDSNDKDPQYSKFLKQLVPNGKSYKLKISKKDEAPCFLEYEGEYDPTTDMNITFGNYGDRMEDMETDLGDERSPHGKKGELLMKKEVSRNIKSEPHITAEPCFREFLEGCIPSEYCAFLYRGQLLKYEEKITKPGSDADSDNSDMLICDDVKDLIEANKNELSSAEKEPSLKKKLKHILKKPYNEEEYKNLSNYIKQERQIYRHMDLRDRPISSAVDGATKSLLDDAPPSFRRKLEAVKNDRHKALNLLRMFCFWLEHVPNEKIFAPWLRDEFMKVSPSCSKRSHSYVDK